MPVIAVINRKGGSGKSTLATHLAVHCAQAGHAVMLGDVDQQQSTQAWLRLRGAQADASAQPAILGWKVEASRGLRPPAGTTHVVLDTPGGLTGFELARVVVFSDAIVMPVCLSVFDLDSAAQCLAELRALPRVADGRCKLAVVGMRVDPHKQAVRKLRQWCEAQGVPLIAALRDSPSYVRCIEQGQTLFDRPPRQVQDDLQPWAPLLHWLAPVLALRTGLAATATANAANAANAATAATASTASTAPLASVMPAAATATTSAIPARQTPIAPAAALSAGPGAGPSAGPSLHAFYATPERGPAFGASSLGRLVRGLFDRRPREAMSSARDNGRNAGGALRV